MGITFSEKAFKKRVRLSNKVETRVVRIIPFDIISNQSVYSVLIICSKFGVGSTVTIYEAFKMHNNFKRRCIYKEELSLPFLDRGGEPVAYFDKFGGQRKRYPIAACHSYIKLTKQDKDGPMFRALFSNTKHMIFLMFLGVIWAIWSLYYPRMEFKNSKEGRRSRKLKNTV